MNRLYRNAELIAKFFKFVGLIPSSDTNNAIKANFKHEPKDFSQNSKYNLHLTKDSSLSDEYMLMFNEKEI